MIEYSPYHKLIPERYDLLVKFQSLFKKNCTTHFTYSYAGKKIPLLSFVLNPEVKETIMITAGFHGNEPAPVYAVYNFLKKKPHIKNKRVVIVPCVTPLGFCLHIDRNENCVDINRDFISKEPQRETKMIKALVKKYKPSFVLNLHEDPDEKKFYLYLEGSGYDSHAKKLITNISKDIPNYVRKKIHTDIVQNGIIKTDSGSRSFESWLRNFNIPNFCTETPGIFDFSKRIQVNEKIIKFALK